MADNNTANNINIEVAYATSDLQRIIKVSVAAGTKAYDAALQSGITKVFPDLDLESAKMGIFGKAIQAKTQEVEEGDRIEIYRPLKADPKASRQARADKAKSARG